MKKRDKLLEVIRGAQKALNGGQGQLCHNLLAVTVTILTPPTPEPKRTVKQYTLDGELIAEHKSCAAAAEAIGNRATRQDISLAARGKAHAAGGYRWKW